MAVFCSMLPCSMYGSFESSTARFQRIFLSSSDFFLLAKIQELSRLNRNHISSYVGLQNANCPSGTAVFHFFIFKLSRRLLVAPSCRFVSAGLPGLVIHLFV